MKTPELKTNDAPIRILGLAIVLGAIAVFVLWGTNAPIDSAAQAPGVFTVESDRSTVQHLEGGIVSALHVHEGDIVTKGDLLIELDDTAASAQLEVTKGRYIAELAREARLLAEQRGDIPVPYPTFEAAGTDQTDPRVRQAIAAQNELCMARRKSLDGQAALLEERLEQLSAKAQGLEQQREINRQRVSVYDEEIAGLSSLLQKGFSARQPLFELQRERAEVESQIARLTTEIAATRLAGGETRLQKLQLQVQFQEQVAAELSKVQAELPVLSEHLAAYTDTVERMDIRAPSSGKVLALSVSTEGGVVEAGRPLMDIVPQDARLLLEARVSPLDIDRVHQGLPAKVQLSAFKSAITPKVEGEVLEVSADRLTDPNTGETYYEARVRLDEAGLGGLELTPGMPAVAMIRTGEHTLLAYLAQPVTDAFSRSFIED